MILSFTLSLGLVLKNTSLSFVDERDYYQLANILYNNFEYTIDGVPTAYRPVGYPFFLSIFISISNSILFLKIINIITYMLTILIFYKILSKYIQEVALYFVIISSLYPFFIFTSGILVPQSLEAMNLALIIYFLIQNKLSTTFISAIIYGLNMLLAPSFILVLPIFLLFILLKSKNNMSIFIFIIGIILVVFPWSYRNSKIFNKPVFISTNGGVNLLLGNSEYTKYNSGTMVNFDKYNKYTDKHTLNEAEKDSFYKREAFLWVINNPQRAFTLYWGKLLNHFASINKVATSTQNSSIKDIIAFLSYYPILFLAFIRLLLYRKFPFSDLEKLFYMIYIFNAFASAIFFTRVRFRLPFDFALIVLASYSIFYLKVTYIKSYKKA